MPEEHKHETKEEHKSEKKTVLSLPFNIKLTKVDVLVIAITLVVLALMSIPPYLPLNGCEVARPAYKCITFKEVMVENCVYWGNFSCDTSSDVSLTQVEWYIMNICKEQNELHGTGLDCTNLKSACNQIVGNQTCPVAY